MLYPIELQAHEKEEWRRQKSERVEESRRFRDAAVFLKQDKIFLQLIQHRNSGDADMLLML
jgi:hypothetical protein